LLNRQDEREAQLASYVGTFVNLVLTVGKGLVGYYAGSRALMADAVHSGADVIGSVAVIIGLRVARKPPDEDHPYGHGRAELVSSAVVALVLLVAGLEVLITSVRGLFLPPHTPEMLAAYAALASIVIKEGMYQYNWRLGRRLHSRSLEASAQDHRTDVYASMAALLGIVLSIMGRAMHHTWLMYMDDVAGAAVAVVVVYVGYKIVADAISTLVDRVDLKDGDRQQYSNCLDSIPGVASVDELRVRDHGQYVVIDTEISVDASLTVESGHEVAERARRVLKEQFPRVAEVLVHVNPYYPKSNKGD